MPSPLNINNITPPRVPLTDPRTGLISREWYRFFLNLFRLVGDGSNAVSLDDLQLAPPHIPSDAIQIDPNDPINAPSDSPLLSQIDEIDKQLNALESQSDTLAADLNAEAQKQIDGLEAAPPDQAKNFNAEAQKRFDGLESVPPNEAQDLNAETQKSINALQIVPQPPLGTMAQLQQAWLPWVTFDTAPEFTPPTVGTVAWDGGTTLGVQMTTSVLGRVAESLFIYVKASAAITKGDVVVEDGAVGASGVLKAKPAPLNTADATLIIGIAAESIPLNGFGLIQTHGYLSGLNTTGSSVGETWADGDLLYYNPAYVGGLTNVKPTAPSIKLPMGQVVNAGSGGSGSLIVAIGQSSVLGGTDSNVQFGTLTNKDLIQYDSTAQYWKNVSPSTVTVGTATNLAGGAAGSVPYQTGAGATTFLGIGSALQVLKVNAGATAPEWVTGAALTKSDDTNVTLTLGGTPSTSLLAATSLTLGWTGQLAVSRGGTGVATTTANYVFAGPTSGGAAAPSFRALVSGDIPALSYVSSVGATSPVASSGGLTPTISLSAAYGDTLNPYASKTANYVLAAPNGSAGAPTFRALVSGDIPALSYVSSVGATAPITSTGGLTPTIGVTAAALTKSDDTNVTLTLGGSPTTALLAATSLTLGWTGQLAVSRGGTGLSSGTSGGVPYFSGATTIASSAALAANAIVLGGGAGAAPATTTTGTGVVTAIGNATNGASGLAVLNASGYLAIAQGGTNSNATPTAGGVGYGTGTAHAYSAAGTTGQALLSNGASAPSFGTLGTGAGGTGLTSFTANGVVYASSTSALATGSVLTFDGAQLGVNGVTVGRGAGAVSTNTAVGTSALAANTSGANNTTFGYQSLQANTTASSNTAVGYQSLYSNTASSNTALGYQAAYNTTSAPSTTAIGYQALFSQTSPAIGRNTAVGYAAAYSTTTGERNVALGHWALYSFTTGNYNVAVGEKALYGSPSATGQDNVSVGNQSSQVMYSGSYNIGVGSQTLNANTTSSYNIAIGYQAQNSVTTGVATFGTITGGSGYTNGTYNGVQLTYSSGSTAATYPTANITVSGGAVTAVALVTAGTQFKDTTTVLTAPAASIGGTGSGFAVAVATLNAGFANVALGYQALKANVTGSYNTAVGHAALLVSTASNNAAFGYGALSNNTSGQYNLAAGPQEAGNYAALNNNSTGSYNVGLGAGALAKNTNASSNTAVGYQAGYSNQTGNPNAFFGYQAGYNNSSGNYVTALGAYAGYSNISGTNNLYAGRYAGYGATGNNNTFVGDASGYLITTGQQNTILGRYNGNQGGLDIRTASNYIVLSDGDGNPRWITDNNGATGYGPTTGGTVTQATSRTTGVTLNKPTGAITLVSAAGTATWQTFTVTNSTVAATDTIIVSQKSGTDLYQIFVTNVATGSFKISFATTGGTTTEQPVFNFAVIKGQTA